MTVLTRTFLSIVIFVSLAVSLRAQTKPAEQTISLGKSIEIPLTVTTKEFDLITDFKPEYFQLFVDQFPQTIQEIRQDDSSLSVGIVIDASRFANISPKLKGLREGLPRFHELSNKENDYFVIGFNEKSELLMDWSSDFDQVIPKLRKVVTRHGSVFLDALYLAADKVGQGKNRRRC